MLINISKMRAHWSKQDMLLRRLLVSVPKYSKAYIRLQDRLDRFLITKRNYIIVYDAFKERDYPRCPCSLSYRITKKDTHVESSLLNWIEMSSFHNHPTWTAGLDLTDIFGNVKPHWSWIVGNETFFVSHLIYEQCFCLEVDKNDRGYTLQYCRFHIDFAGKMWAFLFSDASLPPSWLEREIGNIEIMKSGPEFFLNGILL